MAHLRFRLATLELDEEENVSSVTAIVSDDAHQLIREFVPDVTVTDVRRGGTELTVTLSLADMSKVFQEIGRIPGDDPRYGMGVSEMYESLSAVFYGWMGE